MTNDNDQEIAERILRLEKGLEGLDKTKFPRIREFWIPLSLGLIALCAGNSGSGFGMSASLIAFICSIQAVESSMANKRIEAIKEVAWALQADINSLKSKN